MKNSCESDSSVCCASAGISVIRFSALVTLACSLAVGQCGSTTSLGCVKFRKCFVAKLQFTGRNLLIYPQQEFLQPNYIHVL